MLLQLSRTSPFFFTGKALALVISVLALTACCQSRTPESRASSSSIVEQKLPELSTGAPLPDFSAIRDVSLKKQAFFQFMHSQALMAEQEVMAERQRILEWNPEHDPSEILATLIDRYRVDQGLPPVDIKRALLLKVNSIPMSLLMAQAANESAWGTSRFAKEGNNLFGQWCFVKGCGLRPSRAENNSHHEVAVFDSPLASIRSYIRNLNRHAAYSHLRALRAEAIAQKGFATGLELASGLGGYSERGTEYVKEIRQMIRYNELVQYDRPVERGK